jgi:hypothetical protein
MQRFPPVLNISRNLRIDRDTAHSNQRWHQIVDLVGWRQGPHL